MKFGKVSGIMLTVVLVSLITSVFYTTTIMADGSSNLGKVSTGKIAYDTFSTSDGTATDIPWTIDRGNWVVEDGKFRSEGSPHAVASPSGVSVTDVVWEAKVKPMLLKTEGPEILFRAGTIEQNTLEAVFDYYHTARLLRVMIAPGPYGTPHTTYQIVSFEMIPGISYTMKVIVSGTNLKAYINDALKFDVTDSNLGTAPPRRVDHEGYYDGEWGYWDDVKIWKSNIIKITNLQEGQKIELYDNANNLRSSDTVGTGETQALLDVSALTFPFIGYFKIYGTDGTLLNTSTLYQDIWGGDEYSFSVPPVQKLSIKLSGNFDYSAKENVKVKLGAMVKDASTMELVSDANVTVRIYFPNGSLWVSDKMVERLTEKGFYDWESSKTIHQMKLPDGVYSVYTNASINNGPVASDFILFHIDPPLEDPGFSLTPLLYYATAIIFIVAGTTIGIALFRRHRRLQVTK